MIGIFDSGAGGLSVYREIVKILPSEKYVYFSDNAHCPYGEKTREYIAERAIAISEMFLKKGCDVIVVACNTATAAAIKTLRERFPSVPFIGMEPAVRLAARVTGSGVVGVLATAGTLKAEKYHNTKEQYAAGITVLEHIGDGFVELVEKGITEGPEAENIVRKSLEPLLKAGADTIVLGCTHYPFLIAEMKKICGPDVQIIDPAPAVASHLLDVMVNHGIIRRDGPEVELLSSGSPQTLLSLYSTIQ